MSKKKKKPLNAHDLLEFLLSLQRHGNNLKAIEVNFRPDRNSDVVSTEVVEEDLYDSLTNNILESIVIVGDSKEV
jgi:hypothetical protein